MYEIPANAKFIEVCVCGYVIKSDTDREQHMMEHYDSYRVSLAERTLTAQEKVYPMKLMHRS